MSRLWTSDEERTLREKAHLGVDHLRSLLRRSATAINTHASKLRLHLGRCAPQRRVDSPEGFMDNVEFDTAGGCWLWSGYMTRSGYGSTTIARRHVMAHRLSWQLFRDEPLGELFACHRCDVRACVNPAHLFAGTAADNMADMAIKGRGRSPAGEQSRFSKLTEEQVLAIRNAAGTHAAIAEQYGMSKTAVALIRRGENWKHVGGPRRRFKSPIRHLQSRPFRSNRREA